MAVGETPEGTNALGPKADPAQANGSCGYPDVSTELIKHDSNMGVDAAKTLTAAPKEILNPDAKDADKTKCPKVYPDVSMQAGKVGTSELEAAEVDAKQDATGEPPADAALNRQDAKTCRGEASPPADSLRRGQQESQLSACFNLPDVTETLGAACCDPALLARLGMADASLHRIILSRSFAERRAQDFCENGMTWAAGCTSLEQLQVGIKVSEVCSSDSLNHLYFEYGGGVNLLEETKQLVHAAALFVQKHPRLRLHVDAHAGVGAPRGIATSTSRRRAQCVVQELMVLGVEAEAVSTTSWGRKVASVWTEPEGSAAARAELYFRLDGKEFPTRPEHYQEVPETKRPAPDDADADAGDSSDSDDHPNVRRHRMLAMLRALGYPVQIVYRNPENVPLLARQETSSSDQETES